MAPPEGARTVNQSRCKYLFDAKDDQEQDRLAEILNHFPGAWGEQLVWYIWLEETTPLTLVRMLRPATASLLGHGPGIFPGRSWTKAETAPRRFVLLSMLGIWDMALEEFRCLCGDIKGVAAIRDAEAEAEGIAEGLALEDAPPIAPEAPVDGAAADDDALGNDAEPMQDAGQPPANAPAPNPFDEQKKEQHRFRDASNNWTKSGNFFVDNYMYATC